jgi:hypothetical protein
MCHHPSHRASWNVESVRKRRFPSPFAPVELPNPPLDSRFSSKTRCYYLSSLFRGDSFYNEKSRAGGRNSEDKRGCGGDLWQTKPFFRLPSSHAHRIIVRLCSGAGESCVFSRTSSSTDRRRGREKSREPLLLPGYPREGGVCISCIEEVQLSSKLPYSYIRPRAVHVSWKVKTKFLLSTFFFFFKLKWLIRSWADRTTQRIALDMRKQIFCFYNIKQARPA